MRTAFLAACLLSVASPALACSTVPGYRVPTNVELIDEADLVVLASVVAGPDTLENARGETMFEPRVVLKPIRVLKGGAAPAELKVFGYFKFRDKAFPPLPTKLDQPHPTTMMGACIRQGYAKGTMVVAMFSKTPEGFAQLNAPFARAIEDVEGPDAVWVRATDDYVKLLATPKGPARRAAFEAERQRLRVDKADRDAPQIAADIDAYLKTGTAD